MVGAYESFTYFSKNVLNRILILKSFHNSYHFGYKGGGDSIAIKRFLNNYAQYLDTYTLNKIKIFQNLTNLDILLNKMIIICIYILFVKNK